MLGGFGLFTGQWCLNVVSAVFCQYLPNTERECGSWAGKMAYMFILNAAIAVGEAPRSQMRFLHYCTFDIEILIDTMHFEE